MQGQLVEKCILITPLGSHFSHVSFILSSVKSFKEDLGIWGANVMSLYNFMSLVMTHKPSAQFPQLPLSIQTGL